MMTQPDPTREARASLVHRYTRDSRLALALSIIALAPAAFAQEPVHLTVDEAVTRAIDQSHRLAEARAREEGALAAVESRNAAERPILTVSGGYTRTNHLDEFGVSQPNGALRVIYPDIPNNYFTRAALHWPIYTGGRSDALIRAAEAESRATAADIAVARADLRLEVVRAYWALVTAAESVRVMEEAVARADAHLRDVRSQFEQGLIPPNEVSAVEAQRARQEMQLIEARNLRGSVVEDLRRLTGIDGEIIPAEQLGIDRQPVSPEAEHPEVTALNERIAAADERVAAVEAGRKPSFFFLGALDYANPNPRIFPRDGLWRTSWELGVTAAWTLWDGNRIASEAAEAAAAGRALRARHADVSALIATEIRQRQLDLDSARAALVAAAAAVSSAAESRRVVTERFNVGVATSTEVLDAHVVLLQAELDRTRALASIRLAAARLERALGR
jgi:outer membrane protein TolC